MLARRLVTALIGTGLALGVARADEPEPACPTCVEADRYDDLILEESIGIRPLTLADALVLAWSHDATLAGARAAWRSQVEEATQERSSLKPRVYADAQGSYNHYDSTFAYGSADDSFPAWSAHLNARQPLYRFDWSARGDRADALRDIAVEDLTTAQRDFVARVSRRYLDLLIAQDRLAHARSELDAFEESLSSTQKRYDVGLVPGTDLKDATARKDLAQARLFAAEAEVRDQRDALIEVTGYSGASLPELVEDPEFPPLTPPDIDGWLSVAAENSGDINRAQLQVDKAKTDLRSARAIAMPELDVVGRAGRTDSLEFLLGQRQDDSSVALELTVPIYSGGVASSEVRQALSQLDEAEAALLHTQRDVERRIRKDYRGIQTAIAEEKAFSVALISAEAAEKSTRAGYDAGSRTISDVLDARSQVIQARQQRNASRYQLLIRLVSLYATAGTLTEDYLRALDSLFQTQDAETPEVALNSPKP